MMPKIAARQAKKMAIPTVILPTSESRRHRCRDPFGSRRRGRRGRWLWCLVGLAPDARKGFGRLLRSEKRDELTRALLRRQSRSIEIVIIRPEGMHAVELPAGEANLAITPLALSILQDIERAMNADEIRSDAGKGDGAFFRPSPILNDMVNDDRKPTLCE